MSLAPKRRIVLATNGSAGDVYPFILLGAALRARGHDVVLAAPPDFEALSGERQLPFVAVGESAEALLAQAAAALLGNGLGLWKEAKAYLRRAAQAQFDILPDLCKGADLVLATGLQLGATTAAEMVKAEHRLVLFAPVLLPSSEHPPMLIDNQRLPPFVNRLLWATMDRVQLSMLGGIINENRARLGLSHATDARTYLLGGGGILVVDSALATAPADVGVPPLQVPALVGTLAGPLSDEVERFLAAGEPPFYIGFGSMPDPDPARTTRLVLEAVADAGARAIIGRGWAGLARAPLPPNVLALGVAPHATLFPRCKAVVHHGGAGTTTTVLRAGVPHLVVPHLLDQFYFAERICKLGLGPEPIPRKKLDRAPLAAALKTLRRSTVYAERAARLKNDDPTMVDRTVDGILDAVFA